MSWTRILLTFLLAALLTWHVASSAPVSEDGAKPAGATATAPFLAAVPERIDRVRIEDGTLAVQFEKKDGRWIVTEPDGISPPGDVIDAILESLTTLPPIEIVADGKEHEGEFGLMPPKNRIRLEQQGVVVSTIVLGELSPTRTAVYARKSEKDEVALIGLNAKYYIDLVLESVKRQRDSSGPPVTGAGSPAGKGGAGAGGN